MPDLDPLPPLPRRPVLAPRTGDYDDLTVRVARRRRARRARRTTLASGVAAAAGLAMLFTVAAPEGGSVVADPVTSRGATASAGTEPGAAPSASSAEPSPVGEPSASATATAGGPGGPVEPGEQPSATAAPSPSATDPAAQPPHATLRRDDVALDTTSGCAPGSAGHGPGWCFHTPPNTTAQSGEPHDYVMEACRLPGSGPSTITFHNADEIYLGVTREDTTMAYQWGNRTFEADHHTLTVQPGRCARWTLTWDTTDDAGRPLEPGEYGAGMAVDGAFSSNPTASATAFGFALRVVE